MTRPNTNTVLLTLIAAVAPVLSGVAAVYHERNLAADRQARRDEAILAALIDCIGARQELGAPKPSPPPYPLPAPTMIPPAALPQLRIPKAKTAAKPSATRILDGIARNHGWEEK